ncbi:MAG TPA: outer membrane protein assembly factor BamE [Halothiobacillus sp.]|nr:outer membrane protein assembly factor BamE [Halothiobacillus sp.]
MQQSSRSAALRITRALPLLALLAMSVGGCSSVYVPSFIKVYQPDIAQGNVLEPEQVAKVQVGMSKSEVNQILGTPALQDIFHRNQRETYVFYDKRGKNKAFQHTLILLYDADGRVTKIEQQGDPLSQAPAQDFPEALRNKKADTPSSDAPATQPSAPATATPSPYDLTPPPAGTGLGSTAPLTP